MRVACLGEAEGAAWDLYVGPRASAVSDLFLWGRVVREAYSMNSHFLLATGDDGRARGALALYESAHPVFGRYLATAAFGNDGGFFHDDDEARDALLAEAKALARRLNAKYSVIRTREGELPGWTTDRRYVACSLALEGDSEAALARLPGKTRNQVRRGMKEGFEVSVGPGQVDAFFDVFHRHMRELGSPAHGRRFYDAILRHAGDRADFYVVRDGKDLVGGALLFRVGETASNLHTVTLREYNTRFPNYLLYWKMIEDSLARGMRRFDMGRSVVESPQHRFKANWSPKEDPLYYCHDLVRIPEVPSLDPRETKFRIASACWRNLPLFATRAIGPLLIPGLI
jgi:FemAB-related protein (PEP-CTERM system-associated)